ncbi:hypothetical protein [Riemerella columbipharyngis]|uniref:Beta-carotene 15,15'-monooxygenase n=1 Tax=Riemerella columbipharyngis TaxID=1071918 RepID=A0A1G6ZR58_9FLAO|nr:hypothetical protein [Riemerella columbipharyngis]SDE05011.1 hypothetical protein SAMN05421544_102174 [Riemerella columbipharyngis]
MPNSEFNVEQIKQAWQNQTPKSTYTNQEIRAMLNRKSRNYVKYILWISIAELLLFLCINIFTFFKSGTDENFILIIKQLGANITPHIRARYEMMNIILKTIVLVVMAIFIQMIYFSYRKIRVEENLKTFITRILNFKKVVNWFIFANILILILFEIVLTAFVFNTVAHQNIIINKSTKIGMIVGVTIATIGGVAVIWLYYKVVYGIIMKRLTKQIRQLQDIENTQSIED